MLVAAGKASVSASSGVTVKIGLTPAGRKLLKSLGKLKLTAKCTFTPTARDANRELPDLHAQAVAGGAAPGPESGSPGSRPKGGLGCALSGKRPEPKTPQIAGFLPLKGTPK